MLPTSMVPFTTRSSSSETTRASSARPGGVSVMDVTIPSTPASVPKTTTNRNRAALRRIRRAGLPQSAG